MFSKYVELQPVTAEIGSGVWGTPCKFQQVSRLGFVTAATSLTGGQPKFGRCLAVSWAATLCIHFRGLLPLTEFCPVQNSLYVEVLSCRTWQRYCTTLQRRALAKLCGVVQGMELWNFCRGRHLYSAGRPSRWASAHILVFFSLLHYPFCFCFFLVSCDR